MTQYRLGIDVGGTFTDFALVDQEAGELAILKVPSTPTEPSAAIMGGIDELASRDGLDPAAIQQFTHGTTLALNTILERKGAQVGLLITAGFVDVLLLRRLRLSDPSNLNSEVPQPLIGRSSVAEVRERMRANGSVEEPLDEHSLIEAADRLVAGGAEALVISFLHSYRNPAHEVRAQSLLQGRYPDLYVCTSSGIWPQQREYERTLLSVMNAYIGRRLVNYFGELTTQLEALGMPSRVLSTRSNGGVLTATSAAETPIVTLLSGPAAGVIGAAYLAQQAGIDQVVTLDMGGTSADVAIVDGQPGTSTDNTVGDYPVILPAIDVSSIGAGGGSIAWIDRSGVLKVGPQSAGAVPGPACYDAGGTDATVTDAYLVLGIIDPEHFLGGTMRLNRPAGEQAVGTLAQHLGMSLEETAEAIIRVATANMEAQFLPLMARHGVDATRFVLLPYGGAGPPHAFLLARQVGIRKVLVPPAPGALSALGCLVADLRADFVQTLHLPLAEIDDLQLAEAYATLTERAEAWLAEQGMRVEEVRVIAGADMRYVGQSFEIATRFDLTDGRIRASGMADEFHRQYAEIYHASDPGASVEVINIRVQIIGVTSKPPISFSALSNGKQPPGESRRKVYLDGQTLDVNVYERDALPAGTVLPGPCIIQQYDSTVFVPGEFTLTIDARGNLIGEMG